MNKMNTSLLSLAILLAFMLMACDDKAAPEVTVQNPAPETQKTAFQAPPDAKLKPEQIHRYQEASVALLLLQQQWMDRIDKAQGQDKILLLKALEDSKNQVCTKVGLAGMDEFLWIRSVLSNPVNQELVKTAGISLVPDSGK